MMRYRNERGGRVFSGLILLAAGILLLLDNMELLEFRQTAGQWWPVVLILIGIKHLLFWRGQAAWISSAFWISTGFLFLATTLGYLNVAWGRLLWPLLIIWFGVSLAIGKGGCDDGRNGAPLTGDRS